MKYTYIIIAILHFVYLPFQVKSQSCCDEDEEVKLCYLSAADYCGGNTSAICTGYSLDGQYMENSLRLKLESPQNFGPNGIVQCNLELKKLDVIQSPQTVSDCGCDMVFVPVIVVVDPNTGSINSEATSFPSDVLASILEWSLECKQNLVIISQAEADYWGYDVENTNINPNTQVVNPFSNTIFNGPFGSITSINQGGSYQGTFTSLPSTGTEILAEDAAGKATVALDLATNDIVVGDIGIFCNIGATTSNGAGINNENDIFVCNIFALGCQLASNAFNRFEVIEKCNQEPITLPDGQITTDFGIYIDTFQNISGCDSIIITSEIIENLDEPISMIQVIEKCIPQPVILPDGQITTDFGVFVDTFQSLYGCDSLIITSDVIENVDEPISLIQVIEKCIPQSVILPDGQITTDFGVFVDTFQSVYGCDSLIITSEIIENVDGPLSSNQVIEKCIPESVMLPDGQATTDFGIFIDTLQSIHGCDSTIITSEIVEKIIEPLDLNYSGCEGDGYRVIVNNNTYDELNRFGQELIITNDGCDSLILIDLFFSQSISVDSIVKMTNCNISPFNNSIPNGYDISWTPSESLSCSDCPNPLITKGCNSIYNLNVVTDNDCVWNIDINVTYDYDIYIPNIFSPNGDGINDRFSLGLPPNCENDGAFEMKVFNRWGAELFSSEDLFFEWNGRKGNEPLQSGVYTYWFNFNCNLYQGNITLIR